MRAVVVLLWLLLTTFTLGKNYVDLAWDASDPGATYEVEIIRDGTNQVYTFTTAALTIRIPKPKSGIYAARVRAFKDGKYSAWCESTTTCALQGPWKFFWKPSAPMFMIGPH